MMKQTIKKLMIVVFGCCFIFLLAACPFNRSYPDPIGVPDPLANDNINQFVVKGINWQQIVKNKTLFSLEKPDLTPYWTQKSSQSGGWTPGSPDYTYNYFNHSYGTFPCIDGSTVLIPMAAEFVWQFLDLDDTLSYNTSQTLNFLNISTTAIAYEKLIRGLPKESYFTKTDTVNLISNGYYFSKRPDIVLATHPSMNELKMATNYGVKLIVEPICYDSFVFITHKDNQIDSLTVEQIQKIYSGEITNWNEVGGADQEIVAYQREPNSGSQTAMEEMVMEGKDMTTAPQATVVMGMGMLVNEVAGYENGTMSIGYTYKYYVDRLYKDPNIKILKVNGVMPSDENVRNNNYAFIAPYNAVIRSTDINQTGGKFLDWILSDEGQACIVQAGYVSVKDKD